MGITPGQSAAAATPDVKVMQYNACGNVCFAANTPENPTSVDKRGEVTQRSAKYLAEVDAFNPDVATINETCYSQYRAIRAGMLARGYHATYATTTTGGQCDDYDTANGTNFGNALFSKGAVPNVQQVYQLPGQDFAPDGVTVRRYQLLCTDTDVRGRAVKACVTHIRADGPAEQIGAVAGYVNTWAADKPVIVAGDFNAEPQDPQMAVMSPGTCQAPGFAEGDATDLRWSGGPEPTFENKKIDYAFFGPQFVNAGADSLAMPVGSLSDHRIYRATADWAE